MLEELSDERLKELLASGENRYVEYKEYNDINDGDEILRQLTAFANRAGGFLLYGIRDDATIEGATIQTEAVVERVSNLVQNRTSPLVEFYPQFYHGSSGDVLAFRVLQHKGIPCAVVKRSHYEIRSRRYFIKTHYGVRMMDDRTLEWLFLHQEDPAIDEQFQCCVQYHREGISLSFWNHLPVLLPQPELIQCFQMLTLDQRQLLKSDESGNMMRFIAEIMPYAIVGQLSRIYRESWKVKVSRIGNRVTWGSVPADSERVNLKDVANIPENTLISKMSLDISKIFFMSDTLCLPMGTELIVNIPEDDSVLVTSTVKFLKTGAFDVSLVISPTEWGVDAAPGHPLAAAYGGVHRRDEQTEIQKKIGHICLDVYFTGRFEFPDEPSDEILDYYGWAKQMLSEVKAEWDWNQQLSSLPPGILYSIDRDVREILQYIKQSSRPM